MKEFTDKDLETLAAESGTVEIEPPFGKGTPVVIEVGKTQEIGEFGPAEFDLETTTVWSFPKRGSWATHNSSYRGNWAPQIPRNLILRYTRPGETVLDQMCGSGTTLIECKLLGRNGIGVDVNSNAVALTRDRLQFPLHGLNEGTQHVRQRTFVGDARKLDQVRNDSIDLVATHPPYVNIIPYSRNPPPGDLSQVHDLDEFSEAMLQVACESLRVLKPGKFAAILMGDTRRKQMYIPVAYRTMQSFLEAGFVLKEDIIKHQWNCQATPFWKRQSLQFNFHLIMHEHLFIFQKPATPSEHRHPYGCRSADEVGAPFRSGSPRRTPS